MKAGTVPKITIGAAALVALIFIGFIGVRRINPPTVEERVYLSPWEDGTERPQNNSEGLAAQTNSTQNIESRDNLSQSSTEGSELIDDSLGQPDETDTAQFTAESESDIETDMDLFAEISTLLDDEGQLAEDVMNAYVEALRSFDVEGIRSLITGAAKETFESAMLPFLNGELPEDIADIFYDMLPEETADEMIQTTKEGMQHTLEQMLSSAEVVSSEYIGDELHFQVRISSPEMPGASELGIPEMPKMPDQLNKIRKENGVWRIYYSP